MKTEKLITPDKLEYVRAVFGDFDENINIIQDRFNVAVTGRNGSIKISGESPDSVELAVRAIEIMLKKISAGDSLNEQAVRYISETLFEGNERNNIGAEGDVDSLEALEEFTKAGGDCVFVTFTGKPIRPKTIGQKRYVEKISGNTVVFGVGPAGTGKTYLAVAKAVRAFKAKEVQRIILTRPAVEAGEKLGFLPGDLQNKVDPYLRPLYDALFDMMGAEAFNKNMERGTIEVAPLAYMRGRTLDDSFIILDEAQNTTPEQMKMFLTRLGFNSKMVITGDITQIDLPDKKRSGLVEAIAVLDGIADTAMCKFSHRDVVRHKLVQEIVKAYERHSKPQKVEKNKPPVKRFYKLKGIKKDV
ncbi:MAG: PhoH family protein [Oscillospiraceae bacterium]|nr:PhoH family protein [Oscillospiraceae bacterium]